MAISEMDMSSLRAQVMREANLRGCTPTRDARQKRSGFVGSLFCCLRVILFSYRFGGILIIPPPLYGGLSELVY